MKNRIAWSAAVLLLLLFHFQPELAWSDQPQQAPAVPAGKAEYSPAKNGIEKKAGDKTHDKGPSSRQPESGLPKKPEQNQELKHPGISRISPIHPRTSTPPSQDIPQQKPDISAGQVSLNFDDADVFTVIQTIFGEILQVNYVIDPRVKGRVNFRSVAPIARDKVLPVMEVILRLNGIGVVEDNSLFRLVPISDISKEPAPVGFGRSPKTVPLSGKVLLQVIPVNFIQSSELVKLITPFVSVNAVLIDVPKNNQIILVDTDASIKRVLQLVEIFDNENLKRRAQVFVYPVQNGKAKDISSMLQQIFLGGKGQENQTATKPASGQAYGNSPPPAAVPKASVPPGVSPGEMVVSELTKIIPDEITNSLVVLATPEDYAIIKDTITRIDIEPRQVLIEGMIAQVELKDNLSLGIAALFKANIFNLDANIALNAPNLILSPGSGFSFVGTDSNGTVRAFINALATDSRAKLLATPHILVSDNREARIQIGQQVPIVTSETYGSTTVAPQRTIQYRDIGIILKVKPRVNESGLVALELNQEVSTFQTIILYSAERQIILNKTEANTSLAVLDGQTVIIGGLMREDNSKETTGFPFLSKIPVLGWLFRDTNLTDNRTELIILLTPHVLKSQKEAKGMTSDYVDKFTSTSKGKIKKEELMPETGRKMPGQQFPAK